MRPSLLRLLVLDALMDGSETVETMRGHGEVAPYGLALVAEAEVMRTLRALLQDGSVEACELVLAHGAARAEERLFSAPATDDANLRQYWFRPTPTGHAEWRRGQAELDRHYSEEHPAGADA